MYLLVPLRVAYQWRAFDTIQAGVSAVDCIAESARYCDLCRISDVLNGGGKSPKQRANEKAGGSVSAGHACQSAAIRDYS
jgi:hypothetical protein